MIEIQCPSCQTRYRVDERVLPEDNPTFKCSRCGHVFSAELHQKRKPMVSGTARERTPEPAAPPPSVAPRPRIVTPHSPNPSLRPFIPPAREATERPDEPRQSFEEPEPSGR